MGLTSAMPAYDFSAGSSPPNLAGGFGSPGYDPRGTAYATGKDYDDVPKKGAVTFTEVTSGVTDILGGIGGLLWGPQEEKVEEDQYIGALLVGGAILAGGLLVVLATRQKKE